MQKICIITLIALCIAGGVQAQTTVYVDGSVETTGDGTLAAPFKTITEALALSDATILVAGGTYTHETPYTDILSDQTLIGSYDSSFTTSDPSASPTIIDMGNRAQVDQRGTFYIGGATNWTIENLIIQNSTSGEYNDTENGGAIYVRNGSNGTFRGVTFFRCHTKFEGGVESGPAREGGAVCIRDDSTVVFEDCTFDSCTAVGGGGALRMRSTRGAGNTAKFYRCMFTNCGARNNGAVIDDGDGTSQIEIVNCIFANNGVDVEIPSGTAPSNYLIRISDRRALIYNCTFVGNNNPAGYMFEIGDSGNGGATKEFVNCIFADNTIGLNDNGVSIFNYANGYNDITVFENNLFFSNSSLDPLDPTGAAIVGVNGNISGDPLFTDAVNGDYHLMAGSPGEDAGQTLEQIIDDFNGTLRPVGPAYDIGALEGQTPDSFEVLGVTATASSSVNADSGPEKTVDGSGLNDLDQHDTTLTNMWMSAVGQEPPVWIQYEFDMVQKLDQMWVWNSNNGLESLFGFGVRTATIEYSTDGTTWTALDDVPEFVQAPGTEGYAHNTTVEFGGVAAKFVKVTCTGSWGNAGQYGLSEIRFFSFPVQAREPQPANGSIGVSSDVTLSWLAGKEAAEHNVYISDDEQSVLDGTAPFEVVSQASYGPLSLELAKTYYWRVDEVNNANVVPIWEGNTWSFTTSEYRVVDDFESYNDISEIQQGSNLVYLIWIDGFDNPSANGSTTGYTTGASLETTIVHGGGKSVPVSYDNSIASISEITASTNDLVTGRDWSVGSPSTLSLWFYGDAANAPTDRIYIKVNGVKVTFDGTLNQTQWQEFTIDLASLGINLANVTSLTIGFESSGSGSVFIDDIRLYL